jgi:acyl-CoA thioester hydrolase
MNCRVRQRVRYQETDRMGIVYYANYLVWFEIGRTELLREAGLPYTEFEGSGISLPVLEANCYYKASATYDDEIVIESRIIALTPAKITIFYKIFREPDGKLLAEGSTAHAFVRMDKGRPVNLSKANHRLWEGLRALHAGGE